MYQPRLSMTLKKWVHDPIILGNDSVMTNHFLEVMELQVHSPQTSKKRRSSKKFKARLRRRLAAVPGFEALEWGLGSAMAFRTGAKLFDRIVASCVRHIYIYFYIHIYIYIYMLPPPPRDLPFGCLSSA